MKCTFTASALVSMMLGAGLITLPAGAQIIGQRFGTPAVCGNRAEIVRQLSEKYGETRRSAGLSQGQSLVEVYASAETGSWTILITNAQGTTCLIAAGQAFQPDPVAVAGKPA